VIACKTRPKVRANAYLKRKITSLQLRIVDEKDFCVIVSMTSHTGGFILQQSISTIGLLTCLALVQGLLARSL